MRYLDTCICIDFLRGQLKIGYQLMRESSPDGFQLPSIVVAELYFGAQHSSNPERETGVVDVFVNAFDIALFDALCAREYGRLRQELAEQGNPIGDRDTMIAAMALSNRATVVTNNMKDFNRVAGLQLEVWGEVTI